MSFEKFLSGIIAEDLVKEVPICLMAQHPDLQERHAFFSKQADDVKAKMETIGEEFNQRKNQFWESFEEELVKKDLITQKEVDGKVSLRIKNDVLFKVIEEEKSDG